MYGEEPIEKYILFEALLCHSVLLLFTDFHQVGKVLHKHAHITHNSPLFL